MESVSEPKWYITKVRPTDPAYGTFSTDNWPWLLYLGRPSTTISRRYGWLAFHSQQEIVHYLNQPGARERFRQKRSSINYGGAEPSRL